MRLYLILGFVLMLLFAGCTQTSEQKDTGAVKDGVNVEKKLNPEFWISSPVEGELLVPGEISVELDVRDLKIVAPGGKNVNGEGHFHLYLDDGDYIACAAKVCSIKDVEPGEHVIQVVAHQNDHSLNTNMKPKSVKIKVREKPGFKIDYPAEGGAVKPGAVTVKLSLSNFGIGVPGSNNAPNEGHFHLYLDDGEYIPCASDSCEVPGVTPGKHKIKVDMRNNDHSVYGDGSPKEVTIIVTPSG